MVAKEGNHSVVGETRGQERVKHAAQLIVHMRDGSIVCAAQVANIIRWQRLGKRFGKMPWEATMEKTQLQRRIAV